MLLRLVHAVAAAAIVAAACGAQATAVGEVAPAFSLPGADGRTVALEALRGQVVYVDFWASWCGPCRRSFPWMNELHRKYSARGLAIVAINVDAKRGDAEAFLRRYPAGFTIAYDGAGATPRAYDVKAMPSSYLIDRDGRTVVIERGFRDERSETLEDSIRALVGPR
jgi:cytochrome c biogenesis protein CcmG/thiol:disulfide interchange protein DsbE